MKWRLGLDMGTNSIGWSVIELKDKEPVDIENCGTRIFSDGRDPKSGEPINLARRSARMMRRQRDRKIRRKGAMLRYLVSEKYLPADNHDRLALAGTLDPYQLRVEALERPLERHGLSRILLQLTSRRGFKSNRKDLQKADQSEQKGMLAGVSNLTNQLGEKTLGQWLLEERRRNGSVRFRPTIEKNKVNYNFYPSRDMYEYEFERIREIQEKAHAALNWERLHWIIFFQRPLKRPERGRCQFYQDKDRGYKAFASAHRFRILQDVLNLKVYDGSNNEKEIPDTFKRKLMEALDKSKTGISFDAIRKKIFDGKFDGLFNLEDEKRKDLKGNTTSAALRQPEYFGSQWDTLDWIEKDRIVEELITEDDEGKLRSMLEGYGLREDQIKNTLGYNFQTGTAMLSSQFMIDVSGIMESELLPYHQAVLKLGLHHSDMEKPPQSRSLPYYGRILTGTVTGAKGPDSSGTEEDKYGHIANPTVHIALNQLRKLVNALIRRYGKPTEIILEIARDLKISQTRKQEIFRDQAKNQAQNERVRKDLLALGLIDPNGGYIKKYRLWEELAAVGLSRRCPYCGENISAKQVIGGEIEIEHILPYSRTLLDSRDNLTVAHRACNQFKGEHSPYEAFGSSPAGYDWELISELARNLPWRKRIKFTPHAMETFEDTENGFLQRQLTDNAYLSKAAKNYLAAICDRDSIWVSTGKLTALLRAEWGLNTILNSGHDTWQKNRSDHRHHALDAMVIGLCDRRIVAETARVNSRRSYHNLRAPDCPISRLRFQELIAKTVVSHKPDHGIGGKLYAETALGKRAFLEKILPEELEEKDVKRIVPERIRAHVESIVGKNGFRAAKNALKNHYSYYRVFRDKWVTTSKLSSLSERDLANICDAAIRKRVQDYLDAQAASGKKLQELLETFSALEGIRSVRYAPKDQTPKQIGGAPYKWYMPGDYFRVDIWRIPVKNNGFKYEGVFISRSEAFSEMHKNGGMVAVEKPHPAGKLIASFCKNDLISLSKPQAQKAEYCRIAGYSTTQNKIDIQPINSANTISEWMQETNNSLTSLFWPRECTPQYFKSINVLFSEFSVQRLIVSVDGAVSFR